MADDDKDSKTEAPTAKKQSDAAEKCNVPSSRELSIFATILATFIYLLFFLPESVGQVAALRKRNRPQLMHVPQKTCSGFGITT
ncbi:EscU/YscU/HrcU family type III secretion system export apparatus switch protein, partial [Rhizobium leguminosarum]|uniref:EscU/YscU/HrcU family type III secretion system export apparatus switch protein n=1 Tax=Rhizobium leguminosarum TaxID=384 RepID=UPI003F97AEE3